MKSSLHHSFLAAGVCAVLAGPAGAQEISFGSIHSVTGPAANIGVSILRGTQLAVDEVNAQGGIAVGDKRRPIKLVQYDDKCSAKDAVAVMERLISEDKVPLVLGPLCSHATLAAMDLTEKSKIPMINTISASMQVTSQGHKYIFRTGAQTAMQSETVTRYVSDDLGLKKAVYIGRNDAWSKSLAAQFKRRVEARGGSVLATEFFEHGTTDYSALLLKVKAANPDYLMVGALAEDGSLLVKQARELGIKAQLVVSEDVVTEQGFKIAGSSLNGAYAYYGGGPTKPEAVAYEKAFEKRFGVKSVSLDKAGYDGVMLVADAIKRAGSAESEKIAAALRTSQYKGVRGAYSFEPSGQARNDMWMVRVENMQVKFLKQVPIYDNPPLPIDRE